MLTGLSLITVGSVCQQPHSSLLFLFITWHMTTPLKKKVMQVFSPVLTTATALTHLITAFTGSFQYPIFCLSALLPQFVTLSAGKEVVQKWITGAALENTLLVNIHFDFSYAVPFFMISTLSSFQLPLQSEIMITVCPGLTVFGVREW